MIAKVTAINYNVQKTSKAGKSYTVTEFSYQGEPYKGQVKPPTTRMIFKTDPIHAVIETLKVGDQIELTFNQDQYKSINTIAKSNNQNSFTPSTTPNTNYKEYKNNKDDETPIRIARSVALKAAVDTVNAYLSNGIYKKTVKADILNADIIATAREYEKYLTLNDAITELDDMNPTMINDNTFEQETFDEE